MSDTPPDLDLPPNTWVQVPPQPGAYHVFNKSREEIIAFISPTQPDPDSRNGVPLEVEGANRALLVPVGYNTCWLLSDNLPGKACIQGV